MLTLDQVFAEVLLLLGVAVAVVLGFHRLRIPSSLGYLLVGVLLGPYTVGPVIDAQPLQAIAEFGIVFLLFTIGLSFSLPEIHALRHVVLGLGTAQVALTTLVVGLIAWAFGIPPAAAFVVGAVFAQSSTTIIGKQLAEQGEDHGRHARLGLAMSVFQDVTAVPFVVVIPVLATAGAGAAMLGSALAWALAKGVLAFVLVFIVGRRLLRPLFSGVAKRRSAELFTLTVLFVSLGAGAVTYNLGLSMAFGAFLAGMVLGETEFRHQVEATVRPMRDVLLGLFFVGIGMLIDPRALLQVWHLALLGAAVLLVVKALLVALIVRRAGIDPITAWRTGLLLAVGGEFGFALLALGLQAGLIQSDLSQAVLASVLVSMVAGTLLIRYNHAIALRLAPRPRAAAESAAGTAGTAGAAGATGAAAARTAGAAPSPPSDSPPSGHVLLAGFGRIGQSLARFLEAEGVPYVAVDLDADRVREARLAGERVHYGDSTQIDLLESLGLSTARLVVITHHDTGAALRALQQIRAHHPALPVMVRTRDVGAVAQLRAGGATEVIPEVLEGSLMIASQALLQLGVPLARVMHAVQAERAGHYRHLRELFVGDGTHSSALIEPTGDRLHALKIPEDSVHAGRPLSELQLGSAVVNAVVRDGVRRLHPDDDFVVQSGDTLVLFGPAPELERIDLSFRR